jgi:catechol 2,3-dioxygenase
MNYTIPPGTRIGHVHLKVTDLDRSLKFYRDLLGFEVQQFYGDSAVFISAGGYHHHIGLNTWHAKMPDLLPETLPDYIIPLLYTRHEKILQSF